MKIKPDGVGEVEIYATTTTRLRALAWWSLVYTITMVMVE